MLFKKAIWLRRLSAVFLLLVLAAVSIVQVSHSHNAQQQSTVKAKSLLYKNGLTSYSYHQQTAESKCFICEYQLAKDVDASHAALSITSPLLHPIKTPSNYLFVVTETYSFFETRGPPQLS